MCDIGRSASDFWQMQPYEIWWQISHLKDKHKKTSSEPDWQELYNRHKQAKAKNG